MVKVVMIEGLGDYDNCVMDWYGVFYKCWFEGGVGLLFIGNV